MAGLLRHRQTKGAATDRLGLRDAESCFLLYPFASMSKKDETIGLRLSWILRLLKNLETTRAGKTSSRGTIIHVFRSLRLRTPSFSSTSSTPQPIVSGSAHIALIVLEKRYESKPEGSLTSSRIGYRVST
jgi:hypothetical protein